MVSEGSTPPSPLDLRVSVEPAGPLKLEMSMLANSMVDLIGVNDDP